jgi:putative flippase GtrA
MKMPSAARWREIMRFVQVGVASNLVYFGVLGLLHILLKVELWLGAAIAYAASTVVNYSLHHRHTFRSAERHSQALGKYAVVQASMLAVNSLLLHLLVTRAGGHYLVAQVIAIGVVTCLTYLLSRHWIFSPGKSLS